MAHGFSVLTNHPSNLHFGDIELSEFDVGTFAVVSDRSDLDVLKANNLDGENLSNQN